MSTVGYGDIYCKTYLGRLFAMLFICIGLVSILEQNTIPFCKVYPELILIALTFVITVISSLQGLLMVFYFSCHFNPFVPNAPFLYPLYSLEKLTVF